MPSVNKREDGTHGENLAVDYLKKKGYRILERNFRFERGEIDIIAEQHDTLIFIEVKARRSTSFGTPEDAVTSTKQRQIQKVAEGYLFINSVDGKACRFDVIAIQFENGTPNIRHYENAF